MDKGEHSDVEMNGGWKRWHYDTRGLYDVEINESMQNGTI